MREVSCRPVRSDEETLTGAPRCSRILTFRSRSMPETGLGEVLAGEEEKPPLLIPLALLTLTKCRDCSMVTGTCSYRGPHLVSSIHMVAYNYLSVQFQETNAFF